MKTALLTLTLVCIIQAYPAFTQVSTWTNDWLDEFAAERVGLSVSQAETYQTLAMSMEGHPATQMVKP